MNPLVSLPELKTYLGLTGTGDDLLLASVASNATHIAEQDTGRRFAVSSNVTHRYSTDGQAALVIHDVPYSDASRVVRLEGVELTQDTDYWLLTDRRNHEVATMIQLRMWDYQSVVRHFGWFDRNFDSPRYWNRGTPNDLVITGIEGHPTHSLRLDVKQKVTELAALLYWQAKAGRSGFITAPDGTDVDLTQDRPRDWARFVDDWRIRTGVVSV